jgi:hypothetical protein
MGIMATATGLGRDNHSHRLVVVGLENRKLTDVEREGGNKKGKKEQKNKKRTFLGSPTFNRVDRNGV